MFQKAKPLITGKSCVTALVLSVLLFSIAVAGTAGESQEERWETVLFGEPGDSVGGYCVEQTSGGSYVVTGYYHRHWEAGGDIHLVEGACLIKTAANGTFEWLKVFNGSYDDAGRSVRQTADGGYIITGSCKGDGNDVWLVKTDAAGNTEWNTTFGGEGNDVGYSVEQTTDGGYIVAGSTSSYGIGTNIWLIKTDSEGNKQWDRVFGRGGYQNGRSVQQTSDGGYIIGGDWLIKTDSEGNEEWIREIEGEDVRQTADGGYIITGESGYSIGLTKTDPEGNEEWSRTFSGFGGGNSVRQTTDGGYIITGYGVGDGWVPCSMILIKTDFEGNKQWDRVFGGGGEDRGFSVRQTTDGGYILTGVTHSYGGGGEDALLIKTDPEGYSDDDKKNSMTIEMSYLTNAVSYIGFILLMLVLIFLKFFALPLLLLLALIILVYMWRKRKSE
jgi:hypothetical protein